MHNAAAPARAIASPLQRAFDTLIGQLDAAIKQANLAPSNLTHLRHAPAVKQG
jgi:hypothetical protein